MKRKLLGALGALALWASQAAAQTTILPIVAYDDKAPAVAGAHGNSCNHSYCCGNDGGAYAGVGLYWIQPNFETNPAFRLFQGSAVQRQQDFTYNMDIAPTFWLGWTDGHGVGGRLRYFEYAQGSTIQGVIPAGASAQPAQPLGTFLGTIPGGTYGIAESTLNVHTWDLELTKQWDCECWTVIGTAGLRYAHLAQNYRAAADLGTAVPVIEDLRSGHNFNGAGPTVSVEAKRHIGNNGAAVYANSRLSFVYGTGQQSAYINSDGNLFERHARQADVLPIGELEIGLESNRDQGRYNVMVQGGFVGHVYWGAGNAANSEGVFTNGADNSSNLGFVGLVFRVGVGF